MLELNTLFSGTELLIGGRHHYRTNEILTAYLNLMDKELEQAEKDYRTLTGLYLDLRLEEHMDYEKRMRFTQKAYEATLAMRRVDALRVMLPPYDKIRRTPPQRNDLQDLIENFSTIFFIRKEEAIEVIREQAEYYNPCHFRKMLGREYLRLLNPPGTDKKTVKERFPLYREPVEQLRFYLPEEMDGIIFDNDYEFFDPPTEETTSSRTLAALGFNEGLDALFDDYLPFLRTVLKTKYVYRPFLEEYVHIRHAFLSEDETAAQYDAFMKKHAWRRKEYEKLQSTEQVTMSFVTKTGEKDKTVLCEQYDFHGLDALLYYDFFRGLKNHYLPKKCNNCGRWFLLPHGTYSDYCENPAPGRKDKTCRETGVRKKYEDKCKSDPVWQAYNRAYKAHYARYMKKKMTQREFEAWGDFAIKLRDMAEAGMIPFEEYAAKIRI